MLGQHLPRYNVQLLTPAGCCVLHFMLAQLVWQDKKPTALHWGPVNTIAHHMAHGYCCTSHATGNVQRLRSRLSCRCRCRDLTNIYTIS